MHTPPLILVADDEPELLALYAAKLENSDYTVLQAKDGLEAVKIATEQLPDLVLMDIKMPNLDGMSAARELKKNPATAHIKIVFVTAFSEPKIPDVDHSLSSEIGALGYIKKGINLKEFAEEVRKYLDR